MKRYAVDDRAHPVLANPEMKIPPGKIPSGDMAGFIDKAFIRRREVSGTPDKILNL